MKKNKQYDILVIDDTKTFNHKLTVELKKLGHNITQAFGLKDAEEFIENFHYDFILLDLILPDGDGDELLDSMTEEQKAKVIVLSGDSDSQRRSHIFESGILDYFSKSNSIHKIVDDINNLIITVEKNANINILLVDDSQFMRRILRGILSPKKFNIFEAKDGIDGLKILSEQNIHLVILDYEMPLMDGLEFIEKVKRDVKFLELPIIMLSGSNDKSIVARALKNGASDFLKKPFAIEELLLKCDLQIKNYINVQLIKSKEDELKKALEKTKKAEQYKAMFLANMSHEIRTPLNAILGFVDILEEDEEDEKKLKYLQTIQGSGEMLLNLINDILDFSKIESGKLDINKEFFVLEELYKLIVSLHTHKIKDKNISLKTNIDEHLPKYFYSDFLRIKQILINLIGNAIKFTPNDGEIIFSIKKIEDQNCIEFSVEDNGIGIDPSNHKKIFELFSQAENTTTKKFGGTGLGLNICSKLVEMLGGTIGLESSLGNGSRFYFRLPIVEITQSDIVHHQTRIDKKIKKITTTFENHILLVEDNKTNQEFMKIMLKKHKLTYDIASDGLEALEYFKNNSYDLILMDENMPNMSGTEATKEIRRLEKEEKLGYTPIVALTANAIKGDEKRFLDAGMDEYVTKPINKERLNEIFIKYLNRDTLINLIENNNSKRYDQFFVKNTLKIIEILEKSLLNGQYIDIVRYIKIVKISTMRFKYQNIFRICLDIEQSALDNDKQSCKNFLIILKNELSKS